MKLFAALKFLTPRKKLDKFLEYFNSWRNLPLNIAVMEKAAEIYFALHRGKQIEDNDIYIAATAIVNGCTLVTANDKHFSRIDGLNVENWR
ncbi:MAG: PIN domain-containing protein [Selenomonadaceae bacterium]|nr:PIN domain-containing protein [Selenomonadaceae bacterium]